MKITIELSYPPMVVKRWFWDFLAVIALQAGIVCTALFLLRPYAQQRQMEYFMLSDGYLAPFFPWMEILVILLSLFMTLAVTNLLFKRLHPKENVLVWMKIYGTHCVLWMLGMPFVLLMMSVVSPYYTCRAPVSLHLCGYYYLNALPFFPDVLLFLLMYTIAFYISVLIWEGRGKREEKMLSLKLHRA